MISLLSRVRRFRLGWRRTLEVALWAAIAAGLFYVALFAVTAVFTALHHSLHFDGYAADGPFQLYNPLRRLDAGQFLGRDFQFFHGLGVPLLHFPFFKLFGSNIFASEFTRWMLGAGLFVVTALTFFHAGLRKWRYSLLATSLAVVVFTLIDFSVIYPSNSLVGIRSATALVFGAVMLLPIKRVWVIKGIKVPAKQVILGLLAAVAILLGTEQGLALGLAYGLVMLGLGIQHIKRTVIALAWFGLSAGLGWLVASTIFTAGHPLAPIIYSLFEVGKDQSWYFGTPPNPYLSWSTLSHHLLHPFMIKVYLYGSVVVLSLVLLRRLRLIDLRLLAAGLVMVVYGVIAFAVSAIGGYFSAGQAVPLMRMVVMLWILLSVLLLERVIVWIQQAPRTSRRRPALGLLVFLLLTGFTWISISSGLRAMAALQAKPLVQTLKEANGARKSDDRGVVSAYYGHRIDSFAKYTQASRSVWSTYAGLYESQAGILHPSKDGHDYIIHALGKERRGQYEREFLETRPEFAITMRQSYFPYEEWLWQHHWTVYRHLLMNYHMIARNDSHFLWQRNETVKDNDQEWQRAPAGKTPGSAVLPAPGDANVVYEVKVDYEAKPTLPLTTNLPRYFLQPENASTKTAVALAPYLTTWQFPLTSIRGTLPLTLTPRVDGLFLGELKVKQISYRPIAIDPLNEDLIMDAHCFEWTGIGAGGRWSKSPVCTEYFAKY
ncbi:MAG: hypothetical protein K0S68_886 [Candidatus Saccharibacteria bacterium]|jgi:hypothetical protein|nr:hypothetical protein [Candidatus Saccharibacteria bacterium]